MGKAGKVAAKAARNADKTIINLAKSSKKVRNLPVGSHVRTPLSHPKDFVKSENGWKNTHTGELWERSKSKHYDSIEFKVGTTNGSAPTKNKKITVDSLGRIVKIDK